MRVFESYFAILVTILMLLIIPSVLYQQKVKVVKENIEEYEIDTLMWEFETKHQIPATELSRDFTITTYSKSWAISDGSYLDPVTNCYCINPVNARYVRITYGDKERWFIVG